MEDSASIHPPGSDAERPPDGFLRKGKSRLVGIKRLLLPRPDDAHSSDAPAKLARALFGPVPDSAAAKTDRDLVEFLKRVTLFENLRNGELRRLARLVHERSYANGETISEQGKPGAALYLVRSGVVEITRSIRGGEEIALATLEAPTSFEELAAMGEVVRWTSARARGPVSIVALGRSDLDALGRDFPYVANKILKKLVQVAAARVQLLIEAQYFNEQGQESEA